MEIMQIGLIGGIGPSATDFYYRRLIATFTARKSPLELTIAHADNTDAFRQSSPQRQSGASPSILVD